VILLSLKEPFVRSGECATPRRTPVDRRIILAAVFAIVTWASAFPLIKIVLHDYSPAQFVVLRYLVASLSLFLLVRPRKIPSLIDGCRFMLCGGVGLTAYNLALGYGEQHVASGVASLLVSTSPIFTAIFACLILKEKMSRFGCIGLALGFFGAVLIACSGGLSSFSPASLAILGAAVMQGLYVVLNKPLLSRYTFGESATYIAIGAFIPLSFLLPQAALHASHAPLSSTFALLYLAIVPAALGSLAWSAILSKLPASTAGSLLYLVPVISCALAALWLGEQANLVSFIGAAVAACGVKFVTASKSQQAKGPHDRSGLSTGKSYSDLVPGKLLA
jgi:drug/metabolite transporter (DMT)-like permease